MRTNGRKGSRKNTIKFPFERETVTPNQLEDGDYISAKEVAEMIGRSVSAVYKRAKNDTLPSHKIGKTVVFLRSELYRFIQSK